MKYEKPKVEVVMSDEEDIVTLSQPTVEEDDPNEKWSHFSKKVMKKLLEINITVCYNAKL